MPNFLPTNMSVLMPLLFAALLLVVLAGLGKVPFSYSFRNLVVRWKNTLVTGLAFTVVIFLLVVMLAFVNGMNQLTLNSGHPGNVMVLADGATDEVFSRMPPFSPQELPQDLQKQIVQENGRFLVSAEVYVIVNQLLVHPKPGGPLRRFVQMRGIKDPIISARVHGLELLEGEWFSSSGIRKVSAMSDGQDTAKEAVFGEGVARLIGEDVKGEPLAPGDLVQIGPHWWVVSGIMKSEGSTFGSEVWARDTIIGETFGRRNSYSTYVARTRSEPVARVAAKLLKQEKVQGFSLQAYTERQYFEKLSQTNIQFTFAIFLVAVILAIGGALGVMNTMFAAISQRSKDIGVMRLLGYTRGQILLAFLFESVVLALAGGLLGCALGSLVQGWSASSTVSSGAGGGGKSVVLRLLVDGNTYAIALLFTLAMGLIGGVLPSLSAMRVRPLESLK
jgi:ABC-type antimicrobial peptide transport system permease subunit